MDKKDIHKIDDYLIRIGWALLAFSLLAAGCSSGDRYYAVSDSAGVERRIAARHLSTDELQRASPHALSIELVREPNWPAWLAAGAGVVLLAVGYHLRRRETRIIGVWDILERSTEVPMSELVANTGLSREFVRSALAVINTQPGAYYVWDRSSDMVMDGRLKTKVVVAEKCESCGAGINMSISLDLAEVPACPYCASAVLKRPLSELKMDTLWRIRSDAGSPHRFSGFVFVLLVIVFWPAAIAYALWKAGVIEAWLEKLRSFKL